MQLSQAHGIKIHFPGGTNSEEGGGEGDGDEEAAEEEKDEEKEGKNPPMNKHQNDL